MKESDRKCAAKNCTFREVNVLHLIVCDMTWHGMGSSSSSSSLSQKHMIHLSNSIWFPTTKAFYLSFPSLMFPKSRRYVMWVCKSVCVWCCVDVLYEYDRCDIYFILSSLSIRSNVTMNMLFHLFECDASSHSLTQYCSFVLKRHQLLRRNWLNPIVKHCELWNCGYRCSLLLWACSCSTTTTTTTDWCFPNTHCEGATLQQRIIAKMASHSLCAMRV